jgi:hypothetical protein
MKKRIYLAGYIKFQAKKEQKIGETTEYHSLYHGLFFYNQIFYFQMIHMRDLY